jgi:Flp pilus assembly CpaF family ATPase
MHLKLLDRFDLAVLETLKPEVLRQEISTMVARLLQEEPEALNDIERRMLIRDIQHEMLGFGPIELLMADPTVSDILVNSHDQVYVERRGRLELTDVSFTDEKHLLLPVRIVEFKHDRAVETAQLVQRSATTHAGEAGKDERVAVDRIGHRGVLGSDLPPCKQLAPYPHFSYIRRGQGVA